MGLIDQLLVQGEDSRLHESLVQKRGLTGAVSGGANPGARQHVRYQGTDAVDRVSDPRRGKSADEIIKAIDEEIARLQNTPVTEEELKLALIKQPSQLYAEQEQFVRFGRANLLASYALFDDDPGKINRWRMSSVR